MLLSVGQIGLPNLMQKIKKVFSEDLKFFLVPFA